MYDVAVYLSSLPRIADRERKVMALRAFVEGCQHQKVNVISQETLQIVPSQLAVILGWVGTKIKGPHIQLRKDVIAQQQQLNRNIMPIDGSCFKFADPTSIFLRYSLGGVFYNKHNYANQNSTAAKWNQISQHLNLSLQPWRTSGEHILLCLQRDTGWSMKGTDMIQWSTAVISEIRKVSDRPIIVRAHPKNPVSPAIFKSFKNVTMSTSPALVQDLRRAWASVFFNSSSCVASILSGVPVFATDGDCVAWNISNHDLSIIENPQLFPREQWLYDLSACHWTDDDSRDGLIYRHFKPYLANQVCNRV